MFFANQRTCVTGDCTVQGVHFRVARFFLQTNLTGTDRKFEQSADCMDL